MTSIQHSQYSHLLPSDGHLDEVYIHPSASNRAPSSTCANPFHPCQGGKHGCDHQRSHHPQQEFGGSAQESSLPASPPTTMDVEIMDTRSTSKEIGDPSIKDSSKWMPCRVRLMRKVTNSNGLVDNDPRIAMPKLQDGQQQPFADANTSSSGGGNDDRYNNITFTTNHHHSVTNINGAVRVCSDCNTTKTPLWRSGPRGPKSLCNACGIRRIRKARRAMASAALTDGFIPTIAVPTSKEKRPDNEPCTDSFKKRCRLVDSSQQKLQLEEFTTNLSKNKAFHRVFPREEKEAAVLLMALSWGLIYG